MVAWLANAAPAIASAAGNVISGLFNAGSSALSAKQQFQNQSKLNKQTYQYNLKLQNHQNKFSQSMFDQSAKLASKAHQIEVADLRSAGLNPILSATGGSGASVVSPMSGGSAGMSGGSAQSVEPGRIDLMNAFNSAKQVKNDTQRVKNETEMVEPTKNKTIADAKASQANADYTATQHEQFKKWNPLNMLSQLAVLKSQVDKNMQDIANSKDITKATVNKLKSEEKANNASAYYNTHRALGFSDSWSESEGDSHDYSPNIRNYKLGPFAGTWADNTNTKNVYSRSRNRSRSRTY